MFIIDAVSSLSAMKIDFDALGVDVLLAGTQKAFAMPPTASQCSSAHRPLAKAATIKDRGYYFDFLEFRRTPKAA